MLTRNPASTFGKRSFLRIAVLAALAAIALGLFASGPAPAQAQSAFTVTVTPSVQGLDVSWTALTNGLTYTVLWKGPGESYTDIGGDRSSPSWMLPPGTGGSYRITGLTAGTAYTVKVRSLVAVGGVRNVDSNEATAMPLPVGIALVSNTGLAVDAGSFTVSRKTAQGFVTGSTSSGYTLGSIGLDIASGRATQPTVELWSATATGNIRPLAKLATLTGPTLSTSSSGVQTFTAPAGTTLAANTRYFLLIDCSAVCMTSKAVTADGEDAGSASGWSIDNAYHWLQANNTWSTDGNGRSMRITVNSAQEHNLEVEALANGNVKASWNRIAAASRGYCLTYKTAGTNYQDTCQGSIPQPASGGLERTLTGLTGGTEYTVRVQALDSTGNVIATLVATVTAATPTAALPEIPGLVITPNADGTKLRVTIDSTSDLFISSSIVLVHWKSGMQQYTGEDFSDSTLNDRYIWYFTDSPTAPYADIPVTVGNDYTVRVRLQEPGAGNPPYAFESEVTVTARPAIPGLTVTSNADGTGLSVDWDVSAPLTSSGIVSIKWKSAGEQYQGTPGVQANASRSQFLFNTDTRPVALPFDLQNNRVALTPGTEYQVLVEDIEPGTGVVAWSEVRATPAVAVPALPGLTVASNDAGNALVVNWNGVVGALRYLVQWKSGQEAYSTTQRATTVGSAVRTTTITGLTAGTAYMVQVTAVPIQGPTLAKSEITGTPAVASIQGLRAVSNEVGNALTISWNAFPGVFSYELQWKSSGQVYNTGRKTILQSSQRFYTITGLTTGRTYTVRLRALPNSGPALASREITATPSVHVAPPPVVVRPGNPGTGTGAFQFADDACEIVPLVADGTFNGTWRADPDCPSSVSSKSVSRFYKVVLPHGQSTIAFDLEGGGPRAKMRLWPEWAKSSVGIGDADDPMRARFLRSGAHYLEVEHGFKRGSDGDFKITMSGLGAGPSGLTCAESWWTFTGSGNVQGRWDSGCEGTDHYHREYDLTLTGTRVVTLEATSANPSAHPDLHLHLFKRVGASAVLVEDNIGSAGVARISRTLEAGSYHIDVEGPEFNSAGQGGSFTLDVSVEPVPRGSCEDTYGVIAGNRTITGDWGPGCTDGQNPPTYRRYYDLLVRERGEVTLTLDSDDADPHLALSSIRYESNNTIAFTPLATNDDYRRSKTQSRITRTLIPGRYRVEARTKLAETTGGFSLAITGLGTDNALACGETYQSFTAPLTFTGSWDHGCEAARTPDQQPRYHRYYDLEVGRLGGLKTIVLTSSDADPVLSLYRFAADGSQTFVATNDDDGGSTSRSRIAGNLDWGRYRIYAAPKDPQATGEFTLKVVEGVEVYGQWNNGSHVVSVPATISGNVKVSITSPAGYSTDLHFDKAGGGTTSSVRTDASGTRADRDASLTLLRVPDGTHTIRAMLHPRQLNDVGNFVPIVTRNFTYPIEFTLNYNNFNSAVYTPPGGAVDSPPQVSDKSQFKTHEATVGEAFILVLPAAVPGSGNGGPYDYTLWKRNVNGNIMYLSAFGENGLSFNAQTRTLAGTPAAEGTHLLAYRIHDGDANRKGSDSFLEMTHLQIVVSAANPVGDEGPQQSPNAQLPPNTPPLFGSGVVTALTVAENSPAGTGVGAPVAASDPDEGDTLTYSLSGADAAKFAIDSTGQITTIEGVTYDYERRSYLPEPSYSLTVNVSDGSGGGASIPVTVALTDVDDDPGINLPPEFHEGTTATRTVPENSPAGTKVGAPVTAFDANGDALSYIGFDGADGALFNLDPATGQITLKDGVTYDKSSYDPMVIVMETDTDLAQLTGIRVVITFTEAVEESDGAPQQPDTVADTSTDTDTTEPANTAPSFGSGVDTTPDVDENSAAGTNVGSAFTATDPDEGDTVTYSLTGTDAASFEIGSSTGQITTRTGVTYNYEDKASYSLTVEASDGKLSDAIAVTVSLNDVAEAPTVSDTSAFKTHYATVGSTFTLTLPAADANSGDGGPYTYILWHKGAGKNFATEAVNGLSFDASTRTLSGTPEAEGIWQLNYVVHDGDDNRNAAADAFRERTKLKIVVAPDGTATGDGDAPQESKTKPANTAPSFGSGVVTALKVDENSPAGTNVGSAVTATDPDEGDTLTYSLSGTDATSFDIGSSTGQITTKTGVTYNYEDKSSYSLTVKASDGKLSDSIAVTVSLNNVNEAPAFAASSAARSVAENSAAGTNVGAAVTATDPDTGDTLTYSLSGTDAASFDIGSSTGQITTKTDVTYDYETKSSYSLTVKASDGTLSDTIAVTVSLGNVNEAPAFAASSAARSVAENSAAGTNVGAAVTATDPDTGDTVTYSLSGTDAASFEIGSSTGQITTKAGVTYDYETKSSYSLTVEASDGKLSDSIAVTVSLTDVTETTTGDGSDEEEAATPTAVTACTTAVGALSATAEYAGSWDDAACKAHHQDGKARYFEFTVSEQTTVTITLTSDADAALYVSKDTPKNGWGTVPGPGYDHRKSVRGGNGKLLHNGPAVTTAENDGNTVTLTLQAGTTYTVEAAGDSGDFTVSIAPQ